MASMTSLGYKSQCSWEMQLKAANACSKSKAMTCCCEVNTCCKRSFLHCIECCCCCCCCCCCGVTVEKHVLTQPTALADLLCQADTSVELRGKSDDMAPGMQWDNDGCSHKSANAATQETHARGVATYSKELHISDVVPPAPHEASPQDHRADLATRLGRRSCCVEALAKSQCIHLACQSCRPICPEIRLNLVAYQTMLG